MRRRTRFLPYTAVVFLLPSIASPQDSVTFKAETDLVLVPVVVRDAHGHPVGNLTKDDFRIFDKGKPQIITKFTVEETAGTLAHDRSLPAPPGQAAEGAPMAIPDHFVALLFDDLHMKIDDLNNNIPGYVGDVSDLAYVRNAAMKFLDTLRPADRVAIFTTSGLVTLDFTSDRARLKQTLARLGPGIPVMPAVPTSGLKGLEVEDDSLAVIRESGDIVRRMARLSGQRTVVLVSPGLQLPVWLVHDTMHLIDLALRSRVVFNSLDARGLALSRAGEFQIFQAQVTDGTGGLYIRDTNDLDTAVRELAATPEYIYVLGFSPAAFKPDGSFHNLTVKLENGHKLDVQARKGYWAPDAKELARRQKATSAAATDTPRVDQAETSQVTAALGVAAAPESIPPVAEATLVTAPEPPKATAPGNPEISTQVEPVSFKVQSNLVEVPVIVRDRQGHTVGNLRQEDFRVFDKGKRQEISKFSVQKAGEPGVKASHGPAAAGNVAISHGSGPAQSPPSAPAAPNRFVAFVFDDVNIHFEDLPQVRAAVERYFASPLGPQDRVALFTTSGRIGVDFTNRPDDLKGPLLKITPSPIGAPVFGACGTYVSYFQAVQIDQQVGLQPSASDVRKSLALRLAVEEFGDFHTALQYVRDAYSSGLQEARAVLAALKIVVQRMAAMPGQRSVVLVSPGFFVPADLQNTSADLTALAIRSKVLIGAIDARGVWTIPAYDACLPGGNAQMIQDEVAFRPLELEAETDALIALSEDTGGALNRDNDFDGGVRKAASAPEYLYVLGFVPQNLKTDGSFHALKVTTASGEKLTLQARRGYWAPKHAEDPLEAIKQEIEDAVFAREEIHNLPVEMHTQVTKTGDAQKLNVLTSIDLKLIHLRKVDDRNRNDVTIVAAVFDANGNFIAGTRKTLQLRLRDETVRGLDQKPPVTIDTAFDMHPGAYLVRLVARDAEGQQLTAENAAVQIP